MQQYQGLTINDKGNLESGITVNVYLKGTTIPVALYSDNGVTPKANPLISGSDGSYSFYAASGQYDLVTTAAIGLTSSTTTITLNDPAQPGVTNHARGSSGVIVIDKHAIAVTAPADTTEDILETVTLPPLLPNDVIEVFSLWSVTNNANVKTLSVRLGGIGGTAFSTISAANLASINGNLKIQNRNAANSQVSFPGTAFGTSTSAVVTGTIDTSVSQTIVFTSQKATAGDTITLEAYMVRLTSDGT